MSEQMNQMLSDSGLPLYEKAVVFAAIAHQGAHRKGSRIPYLSHPIEAAAIVSELTDDEELTSFLFSLGCYSGEPITVVSHLKGGCVVSIKDGRYNIDTDLAKAISI